MQKQQVKMSKAATTAMAIIAQDGTAKIETAMQRPQRENTLTFVWPFIQRTPCHVLGQIYLVKGVGLAIRLDGN